MIPQVGVILRHLAEAKQNAGLGSGSAPRYTEDGDVVEQFTTEEARLRLPTTTTLEPGASYFWSVVAVMADRTTMSTELHAFIMAP